MNAWPAPVADRIGKLIRMLSSDKDGEVVAAARSLMKTLHGVGSDIHAVANLVTKHAPSRFRDDDANPIWHEIAQWCQGHGERLRDTERKFVDDMCGRTAFDHFEPTEKQATWLLSIFYRLGGPRE
jgi:hypothetical protein